MTRITGGALRGRNLKTLPGTRTRPTLSRVREAVFNVLGESIRGSRFLDLYAGTGIMGIEALSRGAVKCVFVEKSRRCGRILRENLTALGLEDKSTLALGDVLKWLERGDIPSGIIFADPPYGTGQAASTLRMLARKTGSQILWVVVQHGPREELDERDGLLCRVRSRGYGDTRVDFYQCAGVERQ